MAVVERSVGGLAVKVEIPDGLPERVDVQLGFYAETEDELRSIVEAVGVDAFGTRAGKVVFAYGEVTLLVYLRGPAFQPPEPQPLPVVERVFAELTSAGVQSDG